MLQSGYHTAAEKRILKMLLCEGEVRVKERTGISHFFLNLSLTAMIK
jgi:hypothetical protein